VDSNDDSPAQILYEVRDESDSESEDDMGNPTLRTSTGSPKKRWREVTEGNSKYFGMFVDAFRENLTESVTLEEYDDETG
jgi:hypothetical protein